MRRNLANKSIEHFIQALKNLGWQEVFINDRTEERQFKNDRLHLILKPRKKYCLLHKDTIYLGRHGKSIVKGNELKKAYKQIIAEYKKVRD